MIFSDAVTRFAKLQLLQFPVGLWNSSNIHSYRGLGLKACGDCLSPNEHEGIWSTAATTSQELSQLYGYVLAGKVLCNFAEKVAF